MQEVIKQIDDQLKIWHEGITSSPADAYSRGVIKGLMLAKRIVMEQTIGKAKRFDTCETCEKCKCRVCGCTYSYPCPGGCYLAEWDLCSQCANITEKSYNQQL